MHPLPRTAAFLLLAGFLSGLSPDPGMGQTGREEAAVGRANPFSGVWIRAGVGSFDNEPEPQLPGQRDHMGVVVGIGMDLPSAPFLGFEVEVISTSRKFDTEGGAFIIVVDDETSVSSSAVALAPRISLPPGGPVRAYGTVGLAFVHTRFETDASLFGIPGTAREQTDTAFRPVVGAGVQLLLGRWSVHADYRRWSVSGSFPEYRIQDIALGGSTLTVGAGFHLGSLASGS